MPAAIRRIIPARVRRTWEIASASPGTSRTVWRKYRDQRIFGDGDYQRVEGWERSLASLGVTATPSLRGRDLGLGTLLRTGLLDQPQVRPHLLHHAVLELPAAPRGLRFLERGLRLFAAAGGEIGEAELMKGRRRRRALARSAQ